MRPRSVFKNCVSNAFQFLDVKAKRFISVFWLVTIGNFSQFWIIGIIKNQNMPNEIKNGKQTFEAFSTFEPQIIAFAGS